MNEVEKSEAISLQQANNLQLPTTQDEALAYFRAELSNLPEFAQDSTVNDLIVSAQADMEKLHSLFDRFYDDVCPKSETEQGAEDAGHEVKHSARKTASRFSI